MTVEEKIIDRIIADEKLENLLDEECTSAGIAGYNLPMNFAKNNSKTVKNFDEFNKQRKKLDGISKKELEKKLGQSLSGDKFYKPLTKEDSTYVLTRTIQRLLNEEDDAANSTVQTPIQIDDVNQKAIYDIGMEQIPFIYNNVFVPYFESIKQKFTSNNKNSFQLLKSVIEFHGIISKIPINSLNVDVRQAYQEFLEFHVMLEKNVNDFLAEINTTTFEGVNNIPKLIETFEKNVYNAIDTFIIFVGPFLKGYIEAIGILESAAETPYIIETESFKTLDAQLKEIEKFLNDSKNAIESYFSKINNKLYGSWLRVKIQAELDKLKLVTFTIPQTKTTIKNVKAQILRDIDKAKSSLDVGNSSIKKIRENYIPVFKNIVQLFTEYSNGLAEFSKSLDIGTTVKDGVIQRSKLTNLITKTDHGFFNNQTTKLVNTIIDKTRTSIAQKFPIEKYTEKEYVLNKLNVSIPDQLVPFAESIVGNLQGAAEDKHGFNLQYIGDVKKPQDMKKILEASLSYNGGLPELIQNWSAVAMKNQLILYAAGRMQFSDIMKILQQQVKDNTSEYEDENKKLKIDSLLFYLSENRFTAKQHGHDLNWNANIGTKLVQSDLSALPFLKSLLEMPEESWKKIFFTNEFFKDKLFRDNGETDISSLDAIINTPDVEDAAKELNIEFKKRKNTRGRDFKSQFNDTISRFTLDEATQQALNVPTYKRMIQMFEGKNMLSANEDQTKVIGKLVNKIFSEYKKYYDLRARHSEELAKIIAEDISKSLSSVKELDAQKVKILSNDISLIRKDFAKDLKDIKLVNANTDKRALASILSVFKLMI